MIFINLILVGALIVNPALAMSYSSPQQSYGVRPLQPGESIPFDAVTASGSALTSEHIHAIDASNEENGYQLVRAVELSGQRVDGLLAPVQTFEILRPDMEEITLSRLGTTCSCVELKTEKRTFAKGERAIVELHNVRPTPPEGMEYSLFVQIAGEAKTTLRLDTFVRSELPGEARPQLVAASAPVQAAPFLVSTMSRDAKGVTEAAGMRLEPRLEFSGYMWQGLLSPTQMFELVRPDMEAVTIGRLHTSCSCIEIVTPKKRYEKGERIFLELRNVRPTPPEGHQYSVFVQVTSPDRTMLQADTFVRSEALATVPAVYVVEDCDRNLKRVVLLESDEHKPLEQEQVRYRSDPANYASYPQVEMPENYHNTNKTIVLRYQGKDALFVIDTASDRIVRQCNCDEDPGCPCFPGDSTIVRNNNLYRFDDTTKKLEPICDCSDLACGCDELNVVLAQKDDGDVLYSFQNDNREDFGFFHYCNNFSSYPICETYRNIDRDVVYGDGLRYRFNAETNTMEPQCFCAVPGCKCPGYNEISQPRQATRHVTEGDYVVTESKVSKGGTKREYWKVCVCGSSPRCICTDDNTMSQHRQAIRQLQQSSAYYEKGQQRTGGGGFKMFGTLLGIASAAIPLTSGGMLKGIKGPSL